MTTIDTLSIDLPVLTVEEQDDMQADRERAAFKRWLKATATSLAQGRLPYAQTHEDRRRMKALLVAAACGDDPRPGYGPYYTADDIEAELKTREQMGYTETRVGPTTLVRLAEGDDVPNVRLRDEFLRQHTAGAITAGGLASCLGLGAKESTAVERILGLESRLSSKDPETGEELHTLTLFIPAEMAARIADALGMTYQDAGV